MLPEVEAVPENFPDKRPRQTSGPRRHDEVQINALESMVVAGTEDRDSTQEGYVCRLERTLTER